METRQSHVIVGAITFILLLALIGFILWLARFSGETKAEYDIFFKESVAGLNVGSSVSFSGVPVGQVRRVALLPETPQFVRVRIELQPDTPVLQGTVASLQSVGFTGVTEIQLSGSMSGQKPLTSKGPYGVPVIPARPSGIGQLLETAPQVLDRAAILLERLNSMVDDENRARFGSLVDHLDQITGDIAAEGPALRASIREMQDTMKAATEAARNIAELSSNANALLADNGKPLVQELQKAITTADATLRQVQKLSEAAEPGVQNFAVQTLPQINQLIAELRDTSERVNALITRLNDNPVEALSGNRQLPEYDPKGKAQ
jgi:phospholipid/cholesterol/gamma-HCH transport system substrate-binding protein